MMILPFSSKRARYTPCYQAEEGVIKKDGKEVNIKDPNDANRLGIGMVHQHFKLVECFSVLDNIILGDEPTGKAGFLKKDEARKKIIELSDKYGLSVDPDAIIEDITVGMQQRTEILKMLYRENEILIFDEPTAVLTPQEIEELIQIMKNLASCLSRISSTRSWKLPTAARSCARASISARSILKTPIRKSFRA